MSKPTKHVATLYIGGDKDDWKQWDVRDNGLLIDPQRRYVSFYTTKDRHIRLMLSDRDRFTVEETIDVEAIRQTRQG